LSPALKIASSKMESRASVARAKPLPLKEWKKWLNYLKGQKKKGHHEKVSNSKKKLV